MSDLTVGGQVLHEVLSEQVPSYTEMVLAEVTSRVPAYGLLPAEQLAGDITRVIEQNLRLFIGVLRTRTLPGQEELDVLRESAARRAEESVPIDVVLTAYHIGVQVIWESLIPRARPEELTDVMAVSALSLRYLEVVSPTVGAGYLDERQTMFGEEQSARHTLLTALLNGVSLDTAVMSLPSRYQVLAFDIGPHADEARSGVVAGRRKLRRLRFELERQNREPVLSALTPEGGIALLPNFAASRLSDLMADVSKAAAADVWVGVAEAAPSEVAGAAVLAREVLQVASVRPPGVYALDDVLLEYQLSRPSKAQERLAALLAPLDDELLRTLQTYLRRGSRRPAATELHVHPNTVDYRLRKITELTGLDPTNVRDIALITAALASRLSR